MTRISIIMATYNQASYIEESLRSILEQGFRDYEIIVVNDGSTDDTEKVLEPYRDKIRYLYQPNAGPAAAHNLGFKHSEGDLIAFLNSDDLWMPDKLEKQVRYLDDHPNVGLVHADYMKIDALGNPMGPNIHSLQRPSMTLSDLVRKNTVWIGTVIIRKPWIEKVNGLDPGSNPTEDFDLWVRLAYCGCVFGYVPEVLAKWRRHPTNISRSIKKVLRSHIYTLEKLARMLEGSMDLKGRKTLRLTRTRIEKEKAALSLQYLKDGNRNKARAIARRLCEERPLSPRSWLVLAETYIPILRHLRSIAISARQLLYRWIHHA